MPSSSAKPATDTVYRPEPPIGERPAKPPSPPTPRSQATARSRCDSGSTDTVTDGWGKVYHFKTPKVRRTGAIGGGVAPTGGAALAGGVALAGGAAPTRADILARWDALPAPIGRMAARAPAPRPPPRTPHEARTNAVNVGACPKCKRRFYLSDLRLEEVLAAGGKESTTDPHVYPIVCNKCVAAAFARARA